MISTIWLMLSAEAAAVVTLATAAAVWAQRHLSGNQPTDNTCVRPHT